MGMPRDLRALRCRIVALASLLIALCAAGCLALLAFPLIEADMASRRHMLEELSNYPLDTLVDAPGVAVDTSAGAFAANGVDAWCRIAVDDAGDVVGIERGGSWGTLELDEDDALRLVRQRDAAGSSPFTLVGRTWIGVWLPVGAQQDELVVSGEGVSGVALKSDGQSDATAPTSIVGNEAGEAALPRARGRLYAFLDVSGHEGFASVLVLRCVAVGLGITLLAVAIVWVSMSHALLPVARAREREREFVLVASHELKTPLMAITSACDVLDVEARRREVGCGIEHGAERGAECDAQPARALSGGVESGSRWIAIIREAADEMAASISSMLRDIQGKG